ncbi:MAG: DEAD/DEAH box helicase [Candidatus Atribacteria bacterium]|nr:DEAD/DEAH box helicase [Candidatus Atribacteria bacterium]
MIKKLMRMRSLEDYNIPSYIVDILEKNNSSYLWSIQKKAIKDYGILDCDGQIRLPHSSTFPNSPNSPNSPTSPNNREIDSRFRGNDIRGSGNDIGGSGNDIRGSGNDRNKVSHEIAALSSFARHDSNGKHNLLVIAPPSSGKSLIGEIAVITRTLYQQKSIYTIPFPFMAEDKYRHFSQLYTPLGLDILLSSPSQKEEDQKIVNKDYDVAVIDYEKFNHFLLTSPDFLKEVSLLIIDEIQTINEQQKGPLLKSIIEVIRNKKPNLRIIALASFMENFLPLQNSLSAQLLFSFQRPIELRKGIIREGIFKYVEHNTRKTGKEKFFTAQKVRDNCFEDYLKETVNYFVQKDESTLLLFLTCQEAQQWAFYLSSHLEGCRRANQAINQFYQIKDTPSPEKLLTLLEKGIAYYHSELTRKEKELIETYVRKGEIKVLCAATTQVMEINPNFKNVILVPGKLGKEKEDYQNNPQQALSFIDIENIGGKAGILNNRVKDKTCCLLSSKKEEFGRLIFLAHNKLQETIYENLYFNLIFDYHQQEGEILVKNCLMRETLKSNYGNSPLPPGHFSSESCSSSPQTLNTNHPPPTIILEIDRHHSDRIIFQGEEIKVTARGFSLLYFLAQHQGEVVSYEEILQELWWDEKDAIYTRIIQHIHKLRRDILEVIGNNQTNKEKVKDIFKIVSGRGVMLNINDTEIKIN